MIQAGAELCQAKYSLCLELATHLLGYMTELTESWSLENKLLEVGGLPDQVGVRLTKLSNKICEL